LLPGDDALLGSFAQGLLREILLAQRGDVGHRTNRSGYREAMPELDLALVKTGAVQHEHLRRGRGAAEARRHRQVVPRRRAND